MVRVNYKSRYSLASSVTIGRAMFNSYNELQTGSLKAPLILEDTAIRPLTDHRGHNR